VAGQVSAHGEVNHNYQREHHYNLWFVATAADEIALKAVLDGIAAESGCRVLSLPLVEQFHIDLGFDLCNGIKERPAAGSFQRLALSSEQRRLVAALQPGLPLVSRPFAAIGHGIGMAESDVLTIIEDWLKSGVVKRLGVVVRHHELGYTANAMVVFRMTLFRPSVRGSPTNTASRCATGASATCRSGPTTCTAWCMDVRARR
jgi:DNA-binding Lrp family transcriptional regulator